MSAKIIDGKALAAQVKQEAAQQVEQLKAQGVTPCLAVILVGEDPASQVYVRGKINDCAQCGMESRNIRLPETTTQEELLAQVSALAQDPAVHGILVQLPLPAPDRREGGHRCHSAREGRGRLLPGERGPHADRGTLLSALHACGLHPYD